MLSLESSECYDQKLFDAVNFQVSASKIASVWIIDNFYQYPDLVREFALQLEYSANPSIWSGKRSQVVKIFSQTHQKLLEYLIGKSIFNPDQLFFGTFQYCCATDMLCIHSDPVDFAGVVYLTPNAPRNAGTAIFRHKITGMTHLSHNMNTTALSSIRLMLYGASRNLYDSRAFKFHDEWELIENIENVYNRLVLFDATRFHSANGYFGTDISDARLFQNIFLSTTLPTAAAESYGRL